MSQWGPLINSDKSPTPLLEQLCLGIAQLIPSFDSNYTTDLTPQRLATFYRKVGGNYDPLFLETKAQSLSFIYQSLGCFHSLQPSTNPYEPPSTPSLLPNGFVRWQTIQLLMDPDEHSRYLQNAVELWDIMDPKGNILPKEIPRNAFPAEPDPEMLQWHEGVCRRLEYDFVKKNTPRSSPPNCGADHYHFSGKDPLPDEQDSFEPLPRRAGSRHHRHPEPDRSSRRRHHHRRLSADYPTFTTRRPDSDFVARPDGTRSGFSTPRVPSPPPRVDRPTRSRQDRATWYGHPLDPEVDSVQDIGDASEQSIPEEELAPKPRRRSRHHNLSPPDHDRARRHSHDAYMRKPIRDLSPPAPRRSQRSHHSRPPKASKSHSDAASRFHRSDERSHSRPIGVKFRDFFFDGPPTPAPEPPSYPPTPPPPPPRAPPRHHRLNLDPWAAEDIRRGSYSGSAGGSRPGSGGSSSERPRSFSSAGLHPRTSRWTSPSRHSAGKRYIPTSMAEDAGYIPSRRSIYD